MTNELLLTIFIGVLMEVMILGLIGYGLFRIQRKLDELHDLQQLFGLDEERFIGPERYDPVAAEEEEMAFWDGRIG